MMGKILRELARIKRHFWRLLFFVVMIGFFFFMAFAVFEARSKKIIVTVGACCYAYIAIN